MAYICKLRELKTPVYKDTVIGYGMKLLNRTVHYLSFAQVDKKGEYVRDDDGFCKWDMGKLDSWYYRRFLGDRPDLTTGALLCVSVCRVVLKKVHSWSAPSLLEQETSAF